MGVPGNNRPAFTLEDQLAYIRSDIPATDLPAIVGNDIKVMACLSCYGATKQLPLQSLLVQ